MRQKVLISRKVFDEAIDIVKRYFEVEDNQIDIPFSPEELIKSGLSSPLAEEVRQVDRPDGSQTLL